MFRIASSLLLSLGLGLSGCAAPRQSAAPSPQAAAIEASCSDLAAVDLARIPRGQPEWSRFDDFHRLVRAGVSSPAEGASTQLRLAIPGGGFQNPYGLSVWASRQAGGTWRVSHVRYLQLPPPPPPPGAPPLPSPPQTVVTSGTLTPDAGARIEAALASDCLKREPFVSPANLPMKNGQDRLCPPDGGGDNALEIVGRGASRRYLRQCGRTWASGAIIIALEDRANLIPDGA